VQRKKERKHNRRSKALAESWRLFKNLTRPVSTAEGLATDDTLPRSVELHGSPPTLNLYTFLPSAIVGKYQDIEAALKLDRCNARGVEYNRRSTGGGTVIMGPAVLALGLGINVDHPRLKKGIGGIFESLSLGLIRALASLGIAARFQPRNDIEVNGKKIAGLSASAETGAGLLFHTSLLVDFDVGLMLDIMHTPLVKIRDKGYNCFSARMTTITEETGRSFSMEQVADAVSDGFREEFGVRFEKDSPDGWERKCIADLVENRYLSQNWVFSHKHPRARMGAGRLKTKAGVIEVYMALSGGAIENVIITGDFFSAPQKIHRLENALKWSSARPEHIEKNLTGVWEDGMIHGLEMAELVQVLLLAKENQVRL
jgi:lipoate---protein ligase